MSHVIRRASAADAGALARCRLDLFRELDHEPPPGPAPAFEAACQEALARFLAAGTCVAWVAEAPGEAAPIGSLVVLIYPRLPSPNNLRSTEGYILSVFVAPAKRHRGIASALTQTAINYARQAGFARLRLHASQWGRPVYDRAGFRRRDDEMELDLVATERA
jgi:GNAT superfamily N-acetyltransferase